MSLLDKLWDDTVAGPRPETGLGKLRKQSTFSFTVAGPRPETGLGKLRKQSTFSFRSNNSGKESSDGNVRSIGDNARDEPVRVTRSIMIMKPPAQRDQIGTPPPSPAGSTPPVSPLSGGGSFRFRRRSTSDAYEKASGIGSRSPRPPHDV